MSLPDQLQMARNSRNIRGKSFRRQWTQMPHTVFAERTQLQVDTFGAGHAEIQIAQHLMAKNVLSLVVFFERNADQLVAARRDESWFLLKTILAEPLTTRWITNQVGSQKLLTSGDRFRIPPVFRKPQRQVTAMLDMISIGASPTVRKRIPGFTFGLIAGALRHAGEAILLAAAIPPTACSVDACSSEDGSLHVTPGADAVRACRVAPYLPVRGSDCPSIFGVDRASSSQSGARRRPISLRDLNEVTRTQMPAGSNHESSNCVRARRNEQLQAQQDRSPRAPVHVFFNHSQQTSMTA